MPTTQMGQYLGEIIAYEFMYHCDKLSYKKCRDAENHCHTPLVELRMYAIPS